MEFGGKEYKYRVEITDPINISDVAIQISKQMMAAQRKLKRHSGNREVYQGYNLLMKRLPSGLDSVGIEYELPDAMKTKEQAFKMMHEANENMQYREAGYDKDGNKLFIFSYHRVGKSTNEQLLIESDNGNEDNAKRLKAQYESKFGYKFYLNKSLHGYHLIGSYLYEQIDDWLYDNVRILNDTVERKDLKSYLEKLDKFDKEIKGKNLDFTEEFKKSGLFNASGDFDVSYTLISIRHKNSTLRISKKEPDDKYELIEV